jgi:hypothetical protein
MTKLDEIATAALSANCPRCGYDQRGVITTWCNECPINGICTECGLGFAWADLLNPRLAIPEWCVESQKSMLAFPLRALRTLFRTITPWRMWRDLHMTHPPQWRRVAAYFLLLALVLYIAAAISLGFRCVADLNIYRTGQIFGGNPAAITATATPFHVFLHGCIAPLSSKPIATANIGGRTITQNGTTLTFGAATWMLPSPRSYVLQVLDRSWPVAIVALAMPLCCAMAFAALPISRKRAKVRSVHILRAMAYSYALVWIAAVLWLFAGWRSSPMVSAIAALYTAASPLLFISFWWSTARLYLRMQHGLAVALSVTIIGMLLPITIAGAIWVAMTD